MVKSALGKSVPLLVCVLIVQAALLAFQWNKRVGMNQRIAEFGSTVVSLKTKTAKKLAAYDVISKQDSKLESFLNGKNKEEQSRSKVSTSPNFKAQNGPVVTAKSLRTKLAAILADQSDSAALRQIKYADVDREYGDFFAGGLVKPADLPEVKKLLVDLLMARADASVLLPEGLSQEEQIRATEYVTKTIDDELRNKLGDEAYGKIKAYEASAAVRDEVKTFAARLAEADIPMSPETLKSIEAQWTEAKSADGVRAPGSTGNNTSADTLIARSAGILTPEQQALLRKFLLDQGRR